MPFPNPNNPFVANELYFSNYENHTVYKQTPIFFIHLINDTLSMMIGVLLSILVFYLIFNQMPPYFAKYKKMLLLSAIYDTYMLFQSYMMQLRLKIGGNLVMYTFSGPVSYFGYSSYCPSLILQAAAPPLGCAILPVQYYYRYYTLKKNKAPTVTQTIVFFLISAVFSFQLGINTYIIFCSSGDPNPENADYGPLWFEEVPIPVLIVGSLTHKLYKIHQFYGSSIILLYYIATLLIALLTIKELNKKFASINVNVTVKNTQKQLARALFAQSLVPLVTSVIPRLISLLFAYMNIQFKYTGEAIMLLMIWFPALNLLSTIVFIVPFRRYCLRYIPCSKYFQPPDERTIIVSTRIHQQPDTLSSQ